MVVVQIFNGFKNGLSHVNTQERNHKSIFENCLNKFVVFCQCSGIDHGINNDVLEPSSDLFDHKDFDPGKFSVFWESEQRTC